MRLSQLFESFPSSKEAAEQALKDAGFSMSGLIVHGSGSIDAVTNLKIPSRCAKLPVKFNQVDGEINATGVHIESLEGFPTIVKSSVHVNGCLKLTSLKHAPEIITGNANFSSCRITSLVGCPRAIRGNFILNNNQLTKVDAAPQSVEGVFDLDDNQITSMQNIDRVLSGSYKKITIQGNPIKGGLLSLVKVNCRKFVAHPDDEYYDAIQIINKYLGQGRAGMIKAQRELLENDLDEFAEF